MTAVPYRKNGLTLVPADADAREQFPPAALAKFERSLPADRSVDQCWIWEGGRFAGGYGYFWSGPLKYLATHFALALSGRLRPPKACALHACDNPPCVNPAHLRWGTQCENMKEMAAKKRARCPIGASKANAKLTDQAVREIRASADTQTVLGKRHGIDPSAICRIRNYKSWSHVQ